MKYEDLEKEINSFLDYIWEKYYCIDILEIIYIIAYWVQKKVPWIGYELEVLVDGLEDLQQENIEKEQPSRGRRQSPETGLYVYQCLEEDFDTQ